jgi:hypothetical protein
MHDKEYGWQALRQLNTIAESLKEREEEQYEEKYFSRVLLWKPSVSFIGETPSQEPLISLIKFTYDY